MKSSAQQRVLVAVGDRVAGSALAAEFSALGWQVLGPFPDNGSAVQWLNAASDTATPPVDLAVADALIMDGASLRLSMALRRRGVRLVFFTTFDAARKCLRAELPDHPGFVREASVPDLVAALA